MILFKCQLCGGPYAGIIQWVSLHRPKPINWSLFLEWSFQGLKKEEPRWLGHVCQGSTQQSGTPQTAHLTCWSWVSTFPVSFWGRQNDPPKMFLLNLPLCYIARGFLQIKLRLQVLQQGDSSGSSQWWDGPYLIKRALKSRKFPLTGVRHVI